MTGTNSTHTEQVGDRLEIQDLLYRWCRGVDRRDWDLIRTVFHADAHDDHGLFTGGVEAMIAWLQDRHSEIIQSMHVVGNILIEFAGADRALVESYAVAYQRYSAQAHAARNAMLGPELGAEAVELDVVAPGRYVDVVERRDGIWRIADRTVVFETLSATKVPPFPKLNAQWRIARRDPLDPVFVKRAELGLAQPKR